MSVRLVNGDCFDELRAVPDNSVNLVLTDPPYSSPVKTYNTYASNGARSCPLKVGDE